MSLLDQLPKKPIKSEPDVWVKRVVLYARLLPQPEVIRDIPLHRGLNIVWAEEPESETDKSDIAGHSAGKTTFCRLLRYVLGEKTFSNRAGTTAIRTSFPNGYVAAEIMIEGVQWGVIRPLGENRNSWILRGGTVEDVVANKGEPAYQDSYPTQIGLSRRVENLQSATVVRTQEEIKWGHVLAWCARDQEARFQNVYEWRSPRSESEWPAFRFPKADPLFVMRVLLGLYLRDELGTEEKMAEHLRTLEKAEGELTRLRQEPEFWQQHYRARLHAALGTRFPDEAAEIAKAPLTSEEILPDLRRYVSKARFVIQEEIDVNQQATAILQRELDTANESIAQARSDLRQIEGLFELGQKATDQIQAGLNQSGEDRKRAAEMRDRMCPFGGVLIGDCTYVHDRQNRLQPGEVQQSHSLEQMEAERAAEKQKLLEQRSGLQKKLSDSEAGRNRTTEKQRVLIEREHVLRTAQVNLDSDLEQLVAWEVRLQAPEKTEKMQQAATAITQLKAQIESERDRLNQLLASHDSNRDLLNRIFSEAARLVLPSSNYDGKVNFENRELNFQITRGEAMSGEAIETLAVLLADFSCLIFNLLSAESRLPGFLLHDSPREADLGLRLYHSFIHFVAGMEKTVTTDGHCPFQYILTTTTPPPRDLINRRYMVLRIDASKEEELLFRRNLSRPPDDPQALLPTT